MLGEASLGSHKVVAPMLRKQMFYMFGLGSVTGSISSQQSCLPVGLTHGMGRMGRVGSTIAKKY